MSEGIALLASSVALVLLVVAGTNDGIALNAEHDQRSGAMVQSAKAASDPASQPTGPQPADSDRYRSVFVDYEELAAKAAGGGRTDVERFVSYYVSRSVINHVAPSVVSRITGAETLFRKGHQPLVQEDQIVNTINYVVDKTETASEFRTNAAQVALLHDVLNRRVPHLRDLTIRWKQADRGMSPTESAFCFTFLLTQKVLNEDYQIDPNLWVTEMRQRLSGSAATSALPHRKPRNLLSPDLTRELYAAPSETGVLTEVVHAMLDQLGISR